MKGFFLVPNSVNNGHKVLKCYYGKTWKTWLPRRNIYGGGGCHKNLSEKKQLFLFLILSIAR